MSFIIHMRSNVRDGLSDSLGQQPSDCEVQAWEIRKLLTKLRFRRLCPFASERFQFNVGLRIVDTPGVIGLFVAADLLCDGVDKRQWMQVSGQCGPYPHRLSGRAALDNGQVPQ